MDDPAGRLMYRAWSQMQAIRRQPLPWPSEKRFDWGDGRGPVHIYPHPNTTKEQPTMDSKDGTEDGLDRGQLLLHTHELESRCLELARRIATMRGYQDAQIRELVGGEMMILAGIRSRLGT